MRLANHPRVIKLFGATLLLLALAACGSMETLAPTLVEPTSELTAAAPTATTETTAPAPAVIASTEEGTASANGELEPTRAPIMSLNQALAPLSVDIEGEGTQETEQFIVSKGVMILMAKYEGDGDFRVTISSPDKDMEPSIDVQGPYFGNMLITAFRENTEGLTTGGHTLEIEADGHWRIHLFQDFPTTGQDPTIQFGGVGDGGGGWMELKEGEYTMRAAHDGESDFQIRLHEGRGAPEVMIVDHEGAMEETITINVSKDPAVSDIVPGIYGIGVRADGIWSLIIEDPNAE